MTRLTPTKASRHLFPVWETVGLEPHMFLLAPYQWHFRKGPTLNTLTSKSLSKIQKAGFKIWQCDEWWMFSIFTVCRGHYRSLRIPSPPLPIQAIIHASIIQEDHVLPLLFMRLHVGSRCRRKARQIWPLFITWLQSHLVSLRTACRKRLFQCVVQIYIASCLILMANSSAWCAYSNIFLSIIFPSIPQGCNNSMSASKQKQKTTSS